MDGEHPDDNVTAATTTSGRPLDFVNKENANDIIAAKRYSAVYNGTRSHGCTAQSMAVASCLEHYIAPQARHSSRFTSELPSDLELL